MSNITTPNYDLAKRIRNGEATSADIVEARRLVSPGRVKAKGRVGAHKVLVAALAVHDAKGKVAKVSKPKAAAGKPAAAPKATIRKANPPKATIRMVGAEPVVVMTAGPKAKPVTRAAKGTADELNAEALRRYEQSEPMTEDDVNRVGNHVFTLAFRAALRTVGKSNVKVAQGMGDHAKQLFLSGSHDIWAAVKDSQRMADIYANALKGEEVNA